MLFVQLANPDTVEVWHSSPISLALFADAAAWLQSDPIVALTAIVLITYSVDIIVRLYALHFYLFFKVLRLRMGIKFNSLTIPSCVRCPQTSSTFWWYLFLSCWPHLTSLKQVRFGRKRCMQGAQLNVGDVYRCWCWSPAGRASRLSCGNRPSCPADCQRRNPTDVRGWCCPSSSKCHW